MTKQRQNTVTIRVRVGEAEIEVTGPKEFAEGKIAEFLKQQQTPQLPPTKRAGHQERIATNASVKQSSPAQLFNKCKPKSEVDKVLLAAYYLEKLRNQQDSTALEVRDLVKEAKRTPPKNPNDAINQNIKKGLMMSAGSRENKIAFMLTSDGEAAVEEMLK